MKSTITLFALIFCFGAEALGHIFQLYKVDPVFNYLMIFLLILIPAMVAAYLVYFIRDYQVKVSIGFTLIQVLLIPPLILAVHYWKTGKNYIDDIWRILGMVASIIICAVLIAPFERDRNYSFSNRAASNLIGAVVFLGVLVHIELGKILLRHSVTT